MNMVCMPLHRTLRLARSVGSVRFDLARMYDDRCHDYRREQFRCNWSTNQVLRFVSLESI